MNMLVWIIVEFRKVLASPIGSEFLKSFNNGLEKITPFLYYTKHPTETNTVPLYKLRTDFHWPKITNEEAWDMAAYVNTNPGRIEVKVLTVKTFQRNP